MLRTERHQSTLVLLLDRPDSRNALCSSLIEQLVDALTGATQDEALSAVVLGSTHPAVFAAGGDLGELTALPFDERGATQVLELGILTRAVEDCGVPVIAALGGVAVGGGAELAVACDLSVMGPRATLRFVHGQMGLTPAWGGLTRLEERVGSARASELLFTCRPVAAAEALAIGLVNRVGDDALEGALALAREIAAIPRASTVHLKFAARSARQARRGAGHEAERTAFLQAWGSAPHRAAFAAARRSR
ncbi:MAG: enoyl-CoA hydratase/isomerase family protein [Deltaproteobacteria bacterium]|nr:enoyl-CoA hydratase/isomerase family protein [Deltaproteobacteria bacterium]